MKLIMRADDLGFSEGVNYGIEKAVKDGVITSVGMMTNMESAKHGYNLIKDENICLGQHTNICVGKPLSDPSLIPSLVQENGEFCSSRDIRSRKEDTVVEAEAEIEIEAQLQRFIEITGRKPDYFEAHAVSSNNFFKALKTVAKKHGLFYENAIFDKEWENENGIIGFPFAKLDEKGLYDPEAYMQDNLQLLKENPCCIAVFHPGYLDQYILTHSSFNLIRAMECEFLCGEWIKQWIKDNHIDLVDFTNI
jgi:predicted glycoside hydrolase/deacetylase ChbG (UPF0249 family)